MDSGLRDRIAKAKKLLAKGEVADAMTLIREASDFIKANVIACESCGKKVLNIKKGESTAAECPKCGAMWGSNVINKAISCEGIKMNKREVLEKLWELYRKGDEDATAFAINSFDATGWLAKSLAIKVGLPVDEDAMSKSIPIETGLEKKAKDWVSRKISYLIREEGKPQKQAVAMAINMARKRGVQKSDNCMSKAEILTILLDMFKKNESWPEVNRHTITMFEATDDIDDALLNIVYKKAGKDLYALEKAEPIPAAIDIVSPAEARRKYSSGAQVIKHKQTIAEAEKQGKKVKVHVLNLPFGQYVHDMEIHEDDAKIDKADKDKDPSIHIMSPHDIPKNYSDELGWVMPYGYEKVVDKAKSLGKKVKIHLGYSSGGSTLINRVSIHDEDVKKTDGLEKKEYPISEEVMHPDEVGQRWIVSKPDRDILSDAKKRGKRVKVNVLDHPFGRYIHSIEHTDEDFGKDPDSDVKKVEITGETPPEAGGPLRRPRSIHDAPAGAKPKFIKPASPKPAVKPIAPVAPAKTEGVTGGVSEKKPAIGAPKKSLASIVMNKLGIKKSDLEKGKRKERSRSDTIKEAFKQGALNPLIPKTVAFGVMAASNKKKEEVKKSEEASKCVKCGYMLKEMGKCSKCSTTVAPKGKELEKMQPPKIKTITFNQAKIHTVPKMAAALKSDVKKAVDPELEAGGKIRASHIRFLMGTKEHEEADLVGKPTAELADMVETHKGKAEKLVTIRTGGPKGIGTETKEYTKEFKVGGRVKKLEGENKKE